jgi:hypothetical protein
MKFPMLAAVVAAALTPAVHAQYRFDAIADFPADPFVFIQQPAVNDSGEVTFMHPAPQQAPAAEGLLVSRGGHPRTIVESGFVEARTHSLNDAGQTVFVDGGDRNVYRAGPGDRRTLIAVPDPDPEFGFLAPAINERGTVVVAAELDEDGNTAIFMGRGGDQAEPISDSEEGPLNYHSPPAINNRDVVAFSAFDSTSLGTSGVYLYRHGQIQRIYDNGSDPVINDRGQVAFTRFGSTPGSSSVLRGSGGPLALIADSTGSFIHVVATAINSRGDVALRVGLADGGQGIYVGDGHGVRRVAGTGDTVLDRQVASVSPAALNERGQLAMHIKFSDNTSAIIRATPTW